MLHYLVPIDVSIRKLIRTNSIVIIGSLEYSFRVTQNGRKNKKGFIHLTLIIFCIFGFMNLLTAEK